MTKSPRIFLSGHHLPEKHSCCFHMYAHIYIKRAFAPSTIPSGSHLKPPCTTRNIFDIITNLVNKAYMMDKFHLLTFKMAGIKIPKAAFTGAERTEGHKSQGCWLERCDGKTDGKGCPRPPSSFHCIPASIPAFSLYKPPFLALQWNPQVHMKYLLGVRDYSNFMSNNSAYWYYFTRKMSIKDSSQYILFFLHLITKTNTPALHKVHV